MFPLIYMPLRDGSLDALTKEGKVTSELCDQVLREMLSALDYLAFNHLCHRDVKPQNILYDCLPEPNKYKFQLADFGFVNDYRHATTFCGTKLYHAPEVYTDKPQTPKIDIWALFVTIAEVHPAHPDFPGPDPEARFTSRAAVLEAVSAAAAAAKPRIRPMVREDPERRASAAQMLVSLYGGRGLTTPASAIPPIDPDPPGPGTPAPPPSSTPDVPSAPNIPPVQAAVNLPQQAPLALLPSPVTQPPPTLDLVITPTGARRGILAGILNQPQRGEKEKRDRPDEVLRPQKGGGVAKKQRRRHPRAFGTSISSPETSEIVENAEAAGPASGSVEGEVVNPNTAGLDDEVDQLQQQLRRREQYYRQGWRAEEKKHDAVIAVAQEKVGEASRAVGNGKENVQEVGPDMMQSIIYYGLPGAFPTSGTSR